MPANAEVLIHYGPYESCGVVEHMEHRLDGLKEVLQNDGHKIVLKQISYWNIVELFVNGEMVFKCDIRDLDYGGDGLLDKLCSEAQQKVKNAF